MTMVGLIRNIIAKAATLWQVVKVHAMAKVECVVLSFNNITVPMLDTRFKTEPKKTEPSTTLSPSPAEAETQTEAIKLKT